MVYWRLSFLANPLSLATLADVEKLKETALEDGRYRDRNDLTQGLGMFPVVSLFTGAGGLDLGIEAAGEGCFDFRAWVENDPDCRKTLQANHPRIANSDAFFSDIEETCTEKLMAAARLATGETFLLIGGPPCQAFSTAGLRQSVNDKKGRVVHRYFDMVDKLRPRFFVMENVRGLLSAALVHRPLVDRLHPQEIAEDENARLGSVMRKLILPKFSALGYEVVYGIVCAADYGTAQSRHRVILLGSRDHELGATVFRKQTSRAKEVRDLLPQTHHEFAPYSPVQPWRTLGEAIKHLPPPSLEDTYTYSEERAAVFATIPPGQNWKWVRAHPDLFPKNYLKRIMGGAIASGGGKEGFWRRLSWDRVSPTLTAQPQQLASSLCHPEQIRPLSIPEYMAVQDFPDGYILCGSKSSRYRQVGNAVPLRLAEALGRSILAIAQANHYGRTKARNNRPSKRKHRQSAGRRRKVDSQSVRQRNLFPVSE